MKSDGTVHGIINHTGYLQVLEVGNYRKCFISKSRFRLPKNYHSVDLMLFITYYVCVLQAIETVFFGKRNKTLLLKI